MVKLSFFELTGYSKEESKHFEELCHKANIDYSVLLNVLDNYKTAEDRQKEFNKIINRL